jgi:LPXTG-motif cell wall-anchored protein
VDDVTTVAPDAVTPEVLGAVQVNGELPYTGTDTTGVVVAGLSVLVGGAVLAGLARTKGRNLGDR